MSSSKISYIPLNVSAGSSNKVSVADYTILGIVTPASFSASEITFKASPALESSSYLDVYNSDGELITVTVDSSNAGYYDLTSVFPGSVSNVQLAASGGAGVVTLVVRGL